MPRACGPSCLITRVLNRLKDATSFLLAVVDIPSRQCQIGPLSGRLQSGNSCSSRPQFYISHGTHILARPAGHTYALLMSLYAQLRQKTTRLVILAPLRAGSSCALTCNYNTPPMNIRLIFADVISTLLPPYTMRATFRNEYTICV